MKKYFAIVMAAVASIACQKEINEPQVKGVFTASVESYDETKTFTDATLQVKWSENDFLALWNHISVADKYTVTASSVGKNTADLEIVESGISFEPCQSLGANVGYYPYNESIACVADGNGYKLSGINLPATQTYAEGSFGNGDLPMVAVTSGESDYALAFRNVCGVLRIVLSGDMLVKTISVTGNNNEVLCGSAEVSASNTAMPAITMTGDGKTVTLDCGEGVQAVAKTSFDIVLPPMTFEKGFTININGESYFKTSKPQAIKRSRILCMGNRTVISNNYLKFTSEGETTIALTKDGTPDDISLLYFSESGSEWLQYTAGCGIRLQDGESIFFKAGEGGNATFSKDDANFYQFTVEGPGSVRASGNVMSLLDAGCASTTCPEFCFFGLFHKCAGLTSAPELPATVLAKSCYTGMFTECTSLTTAPELPATTLVDYCYTGMFTDCKSLAAAPELKATALATGCYSFMFNGCKGLSSAPELPAETLVPSCYAFMFCGCSSLKTAPKLPVTMLADSCYKGMFSGCTSLTSAPELPATTLGSECYLKMFDGCTSLASAPELPATALASSCYTLMFEECTSLTTAPELPAATLASNCYNGMFCVCKSLKVAPVLPATDLVDSCYVDMFYGCEKLDYIKAHFTTEPSTSYTKDWLHGVSATGTFAKNATATWDVRGASGVPVNWSVMFDAKDLSEKEPANCYIVSGRGTYQFMAVQGNTDTSVGTVASAEVLWESYGTDTAPAAGDLVSEVNCTDEYIAFKASEKKGNAVIAAKDDDGNILWSWHIWMTDKPEDQVYNNGAGTMMDRNLGATSATKGEIGSLGLMYQWGRKDPFLGSSTISSNTKAASTITWPTTENADHVSDNNTLAYATANPTVFLKNGSDPHDWYCTSSTYRNNNLWASTKTVYDPCPAGYRVPDGGSAGIWSKAFGTSSYWQTSSNWDSTNSGMDFGSTDKALGTGTIWYPSSGCLSFLSGSLLSVGYTGDYWSCTPDGNLAYNLRLHYDSRVYPLVSEYLAGGKSVRCQKIQ